MIHTQSTALTFLTAPAETAHPETAFPETAGPNPSPATEPAVSAGATPTRRSGRAAARPNYVDLHKKGRQSEVQLFADAISAEVRRASRKRQAAASAALQEELGVSEEAAPGVVYPVATDVEAHDALELGDEYATLHDVLSKVLADPSAGNLDELEASWKRLCSHVKATEAEATSGPAERAKALAANRAKKARREAAAAAEGARPAAVEAAAAEAEAAELRRQFEEKQREMEAQRRAAAASLRQAEEAAADAAAAAEADRLAEERAKLEAERAERQTRAAKQALEERAAALEAELARAAQGGGRVRVPVTAATRANKRRLSQINAARKDYQAAKARRYEALDRRCQAFQQFMEEEGDEGAFDEWLEEAEDFSAEEATVPEDPQPEFDRKVAEAEAKYTAAMEEAAAAEEEEEEEEEEAEHAD